MKKLFLVLSLLCGFLIPHAQADTYTIDLTATKNQGVGSSNYNSHTFDLYATTDQSTAVAEISIVPAATANINKSSQNATNGIVFGSAVAVTIKSKIPNTVKIVGYVTLKTAGNDTGIKTDANATEWLAKATDTEQTLDFSLIPNNDATVYFYTIKGNTTASYYLRFKKIELITGVNEEDPQGPEDVDSFANLVKVAKDGDYLFKGDAYVNAVYNGYLYLQNGTNVTRIKVGDVNVAGIARGDIITNLSLTYANGELVLRQPSEGNLYNSSENEVAHNQSRFELDKGAYSGGTAKLHGNVYQMVTLAASTTPAKLLKFASKEADTYDILFSTDDADTWDSYKYLDGSYNTQNVYLNGNGFEVPEKAQTVTGLLIDKNTIVVLSQADIVSKEYDTEAQTEWNLNTENPIAVTGLNLTGTFYIPVGITNIHGQGHRGQTEGAQVKVTLSDELRGMQPVVKYYGNVLTEQTEKITENGETKEVGTGVYFITEEMMGNATRKNGAELEGEDEPVDLVYYNVNQNLEIGVTYNKVDGTAGVTLETAGFEPRTVSLTWSGATLPVQTTKVATLAEANAQKDKYIYEGTDAVVTWKDNSYLWLQSADGTVKKLTVLDASYMDGLSTGSIVTRFEVNAAGNVINAITANGTSALTPKTVSFAGLNSNETNRLVSVNGVVMTLKDGKYYIALASDPTNTKQVAVKYAGLELPDAGKIVNLTGVYDGNEGLIVRTADDVVTVDVTLPQFANDNVKLRMNKSEETLTGAINVKISNEVELDAVRLEGDFIMDGDNRIDRVTITSAKDGNELLEAFNSPEGATISFEYKPVDVAVGRKLTVYYTVSGIESKADIVFEVQNDPEIDTPAVNVFEDFLPDAKDTFEFYVSGRYLMGDITLKGDDGIQLDRTSIKPNEDNAVQAVKVTAKVKAPEDLSENFIRKVTLSTEGADDVTYTITVKPAVINKVTVADMAANANFEADKFYMMEGPAYVTTYRKLSKTDNRYMFYMQDAERGTYMMTSASSDIELDKEVSNLLFTVVKNEFTFVKSSAYPAVYAAAAAPEAKVIEVDTKAEAIPNYTLVKVKNVTLQDVDSKYGSEAITMLAPVAEGADAKDYTYQLTFQAFNNVPDMDALTCPVNVTGIKDNNHLMVTKASDITVGVQSIYDLNRKADGIYTLEDVFVTAEVPVSDMVSNYYVQDLDGVEGGEGAVMTGTKGMLSAGQVNGLVVRCTKAGTMNTYAIEDGNYTVDNTKTATPAVIDLTKTDMCNANAYKLVKIEDVNLQATTVNQNDTEFVPGRQYSFYIVKGEGWDAQRYYFDLTVPHAGIELKFQEGALIGVYNNILSDKMLYLVDSDFRLLPAKILFMNGTKEITEQDVMGTHYANVKVQFTDAEGDVSIECGNGVEGRISDEDSFAQNVTIKNVENNKDYLVYFKITPDAETFESGIKFTVTGINGEVVSAEVPVKLSNCIIFTPVEDVAALKAAEDGNYVVKGNVYCNYTESYNQEKYAYLEDANGNAIYANATKSGSSLVMGSVVSNMIVEKANGGYTLLMAYSNDYNNTTSGELEAEELEATEANLYRLAKVTGEIKGGTWDYYYGNMVGGIKVYPYDNSMSGAPLPAGEVDITGVMIEYPEGGYALQMRCESDLVVKVPQIIMPEQIVLQTGLDNVTFTPTGYGISIFGISVTEVSSESNVQNQNSKPSVTVDPNNWRNIVATAKIMNGNYWKAEYDITFVTSMTGDTEVRRLTVIAGPTSGLGAATAEHLDNEAALKEAGEGDYIVDAPMMVTAVVNMNGVKVAFLQYGDVALPVNVEELGDDIAHNMDISNLYVNKTDNYYKANKSYVPGVNVLVDADHTDKAMPLHKDHMDSRTETIGGNDYSVAVIGADHHYKLVKLNKFTFVAKKQQDVPDFNAEDITVANQTLNYFYEGGNRAEGVDAEGNPISVNVAASSDLMGTNLPEGESDMTGVVLPYGNVQLRSAADLAPATAQMVLSTSDLIMNGTSIGDDVTGTVTIYNYGFTPESCTLTAGSNPDGITVSQPERIEGTNNYTVDASSSVGSALKTGTFTIIATDADGKEYTQTLQIRVGTDVQTGVDGMYFDADGRIRVFNMQGMLLIDTDDAARIKTLAPGIYIVNGRKMVIR